MAIVQKDTRFGRVFRLEGGCKDDWKNISQTVRYLKPSGLIRVRKRPVVIKGQRPMLAAIKRAEERCGQEIVVTGSFRTCAYQAELYKQDPQRFAPPSVGLHCQGLAIDVSMNVLNPEMRAALLHVGFTQARPGDEPWHFSYGWTA